MTDDRTIWGATSTVVVVWVTLKIKIMMIYIRSVQL